MNKFINNLVVIFLFCLLFSFVLTLFGAVLYFGVFLFLIFAVILAFIYAKDWLLYLWYKRHPESRKGINIIEIDGVEFILPDNYINNQEKRFKGK